MTTYPAAFNNVAFSGSSPTTKTSRAMTPLRKGETFSYTAVKPANATINLPSSAVGVAPKTGIAANSAPLSFSFRASALVVLG